MKSNVVLWACLFLLALPAFGQNANYRLEVEVLVAEESSDLFIPLQNYSYALAPQSFRPAAMLPSTAGRIRLQMYLMSGTSKIDIHDLLINGVKSPDQESFVIENPLAWIQRAEPLMIVLADKPYSYYKVNIPIQWSNVQARSAIPESFSNVGNSVDSGFPTSYIPPGYAVQLEARKDVPNLLKFTALQSFGTVYYRQDPSWYRVRVGSYGTREEALKQRNAIRKAHKGAFSKAMLISEEGGNVVLLPGTTVAVPPAGGLPPTEGIPQDYSSAGNTRIATSSVPQRYDLTAKGGIVAQPTTKLPPSQPKGSATPPSTPSLAERAPKFPDWYYNSSTTAANASASAVPEPRSYDAINNNPLPKSYDTAGNFTVKGASPPPSTTKYYVQAGAFGNYANAQRFYQNLVSKGITNAQIIEATKANGTVLYRTWIGPYQTQATAKNQKVLMGKNFKISGTVVSGALN